MTTSSASVDVGAAAPNRPARWLCRLARSSWHAYSLSRSGAAAFGNHSVTHGNTSVDAEQHAGQSRTVPNPPEPTSPAAAPAPTSAPAVIDIDTTAVPAPIDRNIYGHFLEGAFFGNIEGGLLDEGSRFSRSEPGPLQGCRDDLLQACRELGVPVLRWPGGNYTSAYHWTDGVGPRDQRPRRLELAWGEEESNRFGTPEFLAWCAEVGAEPYLAHSCRDVDEAARWVEYTNYAGDTALTRRRRDDGHPGPFGVRYWGLGNEVYGDWQIGHRPVEAYVADAAEHARFMRAVDPACRFIAVGHPDPAWTRTVVAGLGSAIDHVSLHLYGAAQHLTASDRRAEFADIVAQACYFEARIGDYAALVADAAGAAGLDRPPSIAMDEWNMRHLEPASWPEPRRGDDGGVATRDTPADAGGPSRVNRYSPRTLADALFYAGVFHALHRAAGLAAPVTMANTVNMVNAHGLFAVRPDGLVRSATYHVWDLYQNHMGPLAVPATVQTPARTTRVRQGHEYGIDGELATRVATVPTLDASATLSRDRRRLQLAVINRDPESGLRARLVRDGRTSGLPPAVDVRTLGADGDDLYAYDTLAAPSRVRLGPLRTLEHSADGVWFAPHSITLLEFALHGR
jgi:alpha-N-arabinofuranosidase